MKTFLQQLMLVTLVIVAGVGCSKKENKPTTPEATVPDDGGGEDDGGLQNPAGLGGATARLHVASLSVLESYAGRRINSPTDIKVNLDVFNVADSGQTKQYGGKLRIIYTENGRLVTGTFSTASPAAIAWGTSAGTSINETRYNKWFNTGGKEKFKSIFQDSVGALIITIEDEGNDLGTFKGTVYFKNFTCPNPNSSGPPSCNVQSPAPCWNISLGPYDCRAFKRDGSMRPDVIDLPGSNYIVLGTFTGLNVNAALNLPLN